MTLNTSEVNGGDISAAEWNEAATACNKVINGTLTASLISDFNTAVDAAGATMNTDSDVSGNTWVLDEDNMISNSATKVPTQQSVKTYVDSQIGNPYIVIATDGTGDYNCDGTSDNLEWNAAITAANAAGGGTIIVKDGSYLFSAGITPLSNVEIICGPGVTITRASSFDMIKTTSAVTDFIWRGGKIGNDTFINENFHLAHIDNLRVKIYDVTFLKNGGRAIFINGDFDVQNCLGVDVAQFIGTVNNSAVSNPRYVRMNISDCWAENQSFSSTENEFIEINTHDNAYVTINNCYGKGYLENTYDINARVFTVTNCIAELDPSVSGAYAFTSSVNTTPKEANGSFVNCHVRNIGSGGYGFYFDVCEGVSAIGCTVTGDNDTTLAGTGFFADGGASTSVQLIGCHVQDVATAYQNDIADSLTMVGCTADNYTTFLSNTAGDIGKLDDKYNNWFAGYYDNGTVGSTPTIDFSNGNFQKLRLGSTTVTPTFTAPPGGAGEIVLIVQQDGSGSRTITWPSSVKWAGGSAPTLSTAANSYDYIKLFYDGTNYYEIGRTLNLS